MVTLSNGHIIIHNELVELIFSGCDKTAWVFYPGKQQVMLAASTDEQFKSIHKTSVSVLKLRNGNGDKSLSIQELIIDHDINNNNRELAYKADEAMKILTVYL